jgi:rod shape-determining protein MreD
MRNLAAFPILLLVLMLQMTIFSRLTLLSGAADLMLVTLAALAVQEQVTTSWHWAVLGGLMVGLVSGVPWGVPVAGYLVVVGLARLLQQRFWQVPILALFAVVFAGSWVVNLMTFAALQLLGRSITLDEALGLVILPSLLLNMLLAIPVRALVVDLAEWLNPVEETL